MESSAQEERDLIENLTECYERIFVLMGRVDNAITDRQDAQLTIEDFAKSAGRVYGGGQNRYHQMLCRSIMVTSR